MEKWRSRFTVIIVLGLLLSIFVTHNQAQVQAVGTFASDPAYAPVSIEGKSINTHTRPAVMWIAGGNYYFAIKSTHTVYEMSVTGHTGTKYMPLTTLSSLEPLTVMHGTIQVPSFTNLDPSIGLQGNTGTSHWTIYQIPSSGIPADFDGTLTLYVKGNGGGHDIYNVDYTVQIPPATFTVTKTWDGGPTTKPPIVVELQQSLDGVNWVRAYSDVNGNRLVNPIQIDSTSQYTMVWNNLPYALYNGQVYHYRVVEEPIPGYEPNYGPVTLEYAPIRYSQSINNVYQERFVDVPVTKTWLVSDSTKLVPVTLELYRGTVEGQITEKVTEVTLSAAPWSHTFENMPYENDQFEPYIYEVRELNPPQNMLVIEEGLNVTNVELIDFPVNKVFVGVEPADYVPVTIHLLRNSLKVPGQTIVLDGSESPAWQHTFTDLPLFLKNELGEWVQQRYSVFEDSLNNFIISYSDDRHTITNTFNDGSFQATKSFTGTPKGPITLRLVRYYKDTLEVAGDPLIVVVDGVVDAVAPGTPGELSPWVYTWYDLELQDITDPLNPKNYGYRIEENLTTIPEGYILNTALSNDNRVHNVLNLTQHTVRKSWLYGDPNNRPAITLQLKQNGVPYGNPVVLDGVVDGGEVAPWVYTWTNLPKYIDPATSADLSSANQYNYTVEEIDVPDNYEPSVIATGILNTYVPSTFPINVNKVWSDDSPEPRPEVTLKLYRYIFGEENEYLGAINYSETQTFGSFPETDLLGRPYTYYIIEDRLDDYINTSVTPNGFKLVEETNVEITNVYNKTSISITKEWVGPDDRINQEIQLILQRDNENIGFGVMNGNVDPDTGNLSGEFTPWTYTFVGLDKYLFENGQLHEYQYTIKEVPLYEFDISYSTDLSTVTNTYKTVDVEAQKVWENGLTTDHLEVELTLNQILTVEGEDPVTVQMTVKPTVSFDEATQTYSYKWVGLPEVNPDGIPYTYEVIEDVEVPNYEVTYSVVDGVTVVTNSYKPPKAPVVATKTWVNGDAIRPDVFFKLQRQLGDVIEDIPNTTIQPVTSETVTWDNIEQTDINGAPYTFLVKEVDADGNPIDLPNTWKVEENGLTVTNTYTPPLGNIEATKVWVNGEDVHFEIWFKLQRTSNGILDTTFNPILPVDETNKVTWTNLYLTDFEGHPYTYEVLEVNADGTPITLPDGWANSEVALKVTNTYTPPRSAEVATKTWVNGDDNHFPIYFQLQRQLGTVTENVPNITPVLVDETNQVQWNNIEQTDSRGNAYTFLVKEVNADGTEITLPTGWAKVESGLTITNTYTPLTGSITANKVWENGPEEHPTVWFKLQRTFGGITEDVEAEIKELVNGTTQVIWDDVQLTDINGNEYTFSVVEVDATGSDFTPVNYSKVEEGLLVTNTYIIPLGEIRATKVWDGGHEVKPTIYFKLQRTLGDLVEDLEVKELRDGVTEVLWSDVELTNLNGVSYQFKVTEVDENGQDYTPEYYEKLEEGLTIINTFVEPEVGYVFTKSVDKETYSEVGEILTYTFTLTNVGKETLLISSLIDPMFEGLKFVETQIEPEQTITLQQQYEITRQDILAGQVYNSASVTLECPTCVDQPDPQEDDVTVDYEPKQFAVTFTKEADKTKFVAVGEVVRYTFTVKNISELPFTDVEVYDEFLRLVVLKRDAILPNETVIETYDYTITEADVKRGYVLNVATLNGDCPSCVDPVKEKTDEVTIDYEKPTKLPHTGQATMLTHWISYPTLIGGLYLVIKRKKED